MATIDIVKEVLAGNLGIDAGEITADATLDSLGVDSLDMVELVCDIEDRCDVEFGEPSGLKTVGEIADYIDSLK